MKILLLYLTLTIGLASCKFRFDNYTVFKISPKNEEQVNLLRNLQQDKSLDFWNDVYPNVEYVSVMASPDKKQGLESVFNTYDVSFEVTLDNVQEAIDKETIGTYTRNSRSMRWDAFYTLTDIEAWLEDIATGYPDIVTPLIGGESYEGRQIRGIKISHGSGRRIIFIEGGIHAREWLSPSTVCYIITQLLTSTDEATRAAAREFDWHIFPVTNPDGYVWSHDEFRLWRKNRRPVGSNFGIDLNRNWNSNWMKEGVSEDPAADNYPGLGPFSEPESRTLSTYISSIGDSIDMYISFHTFGQLLLIPYGNTTEPLDNYYDAVNIGRRAMGALSVRHGTQYVTGNIAEAIYFATGTSIEWVKEHLRVPLVYLYELRDTGVMGHVTTVDQILPSHLEVMDSVIDLIYQARRFGYLNSGASIKATFGLVVLAVCKILF